MKIALVYEKFISRGGLENYLYLFARQLIACGHHLKIITGETDSKTEGLKDTRIYRIPRKSLAQFSAGAESALENLPHDVSIGFGRTVAHDLHRAGGGCHRYYSDHVLHPLKRVGAKNRSELALEKELYTSGKTRHFVVNSQMVSEQLQEAYSLSPERISIIHTAVNSEKFQPASSAESRSVTRGGLPAETPIFIFVSMNHRRKGLDALLKAWPQTPPESQLWIVGPELGSRYSKLIDRAKIGDRVRSFVKPDNLVELYQAADFFIHPTLYDACANTVLQSMACGLPGIISECDGARQFVSEGETGLRLPHPSDSDEIAAKIAQILGLSASERQQMASASRARVTALTWPEHVARWEDVICKAADS